MLVIGKYPSFGLIIVFDIIVLLAGNVTGGTGDRCDGALDWYASVVQRDGDCAREAVAFRGYIHAKAILLFADSENDVEHVVVGFVDHTMGD